jgi:thioesterase domain-containing protein
MDDERARTLENYLHEKIPISAFMQVSVSAASQASVVLSAPLAPNINHERTVFGGSAAAVATLAAWSLVHLRLSETEAAFHLVIMSNRIDYERPMTGRFEAEASFPDTARWPVFLRTLSARRRARIGVGSVLRCESAVAGHFEGQFVAILA